MKKLLPFLLMLVLLVGGYLWWNSSQSATVTASTDFIAALTNDATDGYALALEPNAIQFPRDLGSHPDYQTEWWYYTGNLVGEGGRDFGFQLTFFRTALTPPVSSEQSDDQPPATSNQSPSWSSNQIYFAHFTISDVANENFYPSEQFSRGAADLAGATATPYDVWINDWYARENEDGTVQLFAETDDVALNLTLSQTLPPVLHGDAGLSQKGEAEGNASYYYSFVQQQAVGTVTVQNETFAVTGKAWKDHEYSTSALEAGAVGWDWVSLQFDNGTALMLFQIRRDDGTLEPWSSGTFIAADGTPTDLRLGDWQIAVTDNWRSPATNINYPTAWTLVVPKVGLDIVGEALMPNQELNLSTTYWEGAVGFAGIFAGDTISAKGYIEMTGYTE